MALIINGNRVAGTGKPGKKGDPFTYEDFTAEQLEGLRGLPGPAGQGIAQGGTSGQILTKKSDTDYDTQWVDKPTYTASEVGALPNTTVIPSKTSQLTNDSGFITGYTETDPTVPAWAKAASKPTYTAAEVGAATASHNQAASTITAGTFAETGVKAAAGTDYTTDRVRNIVLTTTDPGAGTTSSYANGTVVLVYE